MEIRDRKVVKRPKFRKFQGRFRARLRVACNETPARRAKRPHSASSEIDEGNNSNLTFSFLSEIQWFWHRGSTNSHPKFLIFDPIPDPQNPQIPRRRPKNSTSEIQKLWGPQIVASQNLAKSVPKPWLSDPIPMTSHGNAPAIRSKSAQGPWVWV